MNKLFNELQKEIKKVSLTQEEKDVMLSYILTNTSYENLTSTVEKPARKIKSYSFATLFMQPRAVAFVLLFSIITSTTATSVFAEKALPGDILYPIKTKINEPTVGLLATTQESKVAWQEKLTERRLTEAEEVISRGNLDQKTRELIEKNVNTQIDTFTEAVTKLEDDNNDEDTKAIKTSQATLRVEAVLLAHQEVLRGSKRGKQEPAPMLMAMTEMVATTSPTEETVREGKHDERKLFAESLKKQESKVRYYRNQAESRVGISQATTMQASSTTGVETSPLVMRVRKVAPTKDTTVLRTIEDKKESAEKVHTKLKQSFETMKDTLPEVARNELQTKIDQEEKLLNDALTASTSASYDQALALYQSVIASSNEITILMLSKVIKKEIEATRRDTRTNNSQRNSWQNRVKSTRDSFNDKQEEKTDNENDKEDR